ncbi:MAG: DNA mismatch repair endonuclease MutL [Halobacteriovoraceae bacterium]|nr:DNA mismatch repair endonuclease MutL [Halobacteriovoraceae bacterium]
MNLPLKSKIRPLPPYLIDQIKAGEVIERPASLIKEVLENSIDAKASKIELTIEGGGLDLIAVEDNGMGMEQHELPNAFKRHSTSKIQKFEDIYRLGSFGFRGEALASMASISRVSCTSDTMKKKHGGKIIIEGGKQISLIPAKKNHPGTSLYIRNLFYNTPARLKFIKSKSSEKIAIKKVLGAFLLAFPQVDFSIKWDQSEKEIYPAVPPKEIEKRIKQFFFKRNNTFNLLKVNKYFENNHIEGYISSQSISGYTSKNQYLLVNERYFTDRTLHAAIMRCMESFWGTGRTGAYFLKYTLPKQKVDINVHPNKMQVHFEDAPLIYSLTTASIKSTLQNNLPHDDKNSTFRNSQINKTISTPVNKLVNGKYSQILIPSSKVPEDGKLYYPISSKYILTERQEKIWLVNWKKLTLKYLYFHFFGLSSRKENQPLLIGEPFNYTGIKDIDLNWFKKKGLDFHILDEQSLILRSIPNYLYEFPLQKIVGNLLLFFEKKHFDLKKCQLDFIKEFSNFDFIPSFHIFTNCLETFPVEELQTKNILCLFDENMLDSFWKA